MMTPPDLACQPSSSPSPHLRQCLLSEFVMSTPQQSRTVKRILEFPESQSSGPVPTIISSPTYPSATPPPSTSGMSLASHTVCPSSKQATSAMPTLLSVSPALLNTTNTSATADVVNPKKRIRSKKSSVRGECSDTTNCAYIKEDELNTEIRNTELKCLKLEIEVKECTRKIKNLEQEVKTVSLHNTKLKQELLTLQLENAKKTAVVLQNLNNLIIAGEQILSKCKA